MNRHLTEGELRASLDGEAESSRLHHLETCAECWERRQQLQRQSERLAQRLGFLAGANEPTPAAQAAWSKFSGRIRSHKETSMLRKWFAYPVARFGVIALLLLALVLALPGTRAMAGELLNLFRVQQLAVIPVDFTGLQQLTGDAAGKQFSQLISRSIDVTQEPGDPVAAADAAEASSLAGFTVRLPQDQTPSQIYVEGATEFNMTIDRDRAQALLDESGRSDLVLPDSIDGAKISAHIPAAVSAGYGTCPKPAQDVPQGADPDIPSYLYEDCVILAQIPSPTVDAPAGVDVAQLAQIGLEFTGMSSEEAAAFTKSVDWTSTLVVPIPRNATTYEQVVVDGVTGTLIKRPVQFALLWVKDGIIYAISGQGANSQQVLDMANSLP